MKYCHVCKAWQNNINLFCPDCGDRLMSNEYSSEDSDDGYFEGENQLTKMFMIKHKKDGQQQWETLPMNTIYAGSWHEAKVKFTEWVAEFYKDIDSEYSMSILAEREKNPLSSFKYGSTTYTINKV